MQEKNCQIVLVGHTSHKLILSIDKEITHKLIFITEREPLPGTPEAKKILEALNKYYKERRIEVKNEKFDFHISTKPIAELIHLIYQQKLLNYDNITINISGGLRYMDIWFYIASSITNSRVIHGDFIYEKNEEVGIYSNAEMQTIPFQSLTDKQFEFLALFFGEYNNWIQFFDPELSFNENLLLNQRITYQSLEELKAAMEKVRNETISRGSINGFIQKLSTISALNVYPNPIDKKEKSIEISYFGIAYFLNSLFQKYLIKNRGSNSVQ
ncbi:hypothetical protein ES703_06068 [subsurface metagenome]